jgi:RNA 2',3'-cyclic 3'-phosphodiesterase
VRLFVALDLPEEVRLKLAGVIEQLKPKCPSARWVRPESMHLTLKFIGHAVADGDTQKLADLQAALASVHSERAVELHYRGVGFFPNSRRPRVIWCGVVASPNLSKIAADIEAALAPLGIPREERSFVPHLTLARIESPAGTEALVRAAEVLQSSDFGSSTEMQFHLFESTTKPSGAEYKKLHAFAFAKGLQ